MALVSVSALLGKVGDAVSKVTVIFTDGMRRVKTREELHEILFSMGDEMQYWRRQYWVNRSETSDAVMFDGKVFTVRLLDCRSKFLSCDNSISCFACHATHLYVDDKHIGAYFDEDMLKRLLQEVTL